MTVKITTPIQGGAIQAVASKSEAHRLLICAALADSETAITCPTRSADIDATTRCLQALGATVRYGQNKFTITPIKRSQINTSQTHIQDCGESGSTLRFMLPVCGALGINADFHMAGRLPERPLHALYDEMVSHGCTLSKQGHSPLTCKGLLNSGIFTLPGNISSQFISGLLFALPLLHNDSIIQVTGVLESRPYVDMTLDTLRLFKIEITENETNTFHIKGSQQFHSPKIAKAGGDWSNAAFWLVAGAIGKNAITCTGLDQHSRQGDRAIVELLSRFNANVTCISGAVTVSRDKLRGMDIDAGDIPDLVPALAAVASVAEGRTIIRNAKRLRMKESDRLHTVAVSLSSLGSDISETEDGLVIIGKKELTGGETHSFGDHRIAMTAAVLSTACTGPVVIRDAQAVRKSYPGFFEDFSAALGGVCEIEA